MEQPNLNYINQMSSTDEVFKAKLILILKEELPQEAHLYTQHITKKEFNLAANLVHKLKHKVAILGLSKDYEIAEEHENALKKEDFSLIKDFSHILDKMLKFVVELH